MFETHRFACLLPLVCVVFVCIGCVLYMGATGAGTRQRARVGVQGGGARQNERMVRSRSRSVQFWIGGGGT
jgi:hypothetical protein